MRDAIAMVVLGCAGLASLAACGDDASDSQPTAGGPPMPMMVGDLCDGTGCPQGTVCQSGGHFAGQCTADCNGDMGCLLLGSRAHCVSGKCVITCASDAECVTGTACVLVTDRMACARQ